MISKIGHLEHFFWDFMAKFLEIINMFMVIADAFVFDCDDTFAKRPGPRLGATEEPHSLAD